MGTAISTPDKPKLSQHVVPWGQLDEVAVSRIAQLPITCYPAFWLVGVWLEMWEHDQDA